MGRVELKSLIGFLFLSLDFLTNFSEKKLKTFFFFTVLLTMPITVSAATGDGCTTAENVDVPSTTSVRLEHYWRSGRYYYYKFTAPADGTVHIYTTNANTDTDGEILNSDCSIDLDTDTSYNNNVDLTYDISTGTVYKVLLYNYDRRNDDNFILHIDFTSATNNPPMTSPYPSLIVSEFVPEFIVFIPAPIIKADAIEKPIRSHWGRHKLCFRSKYGL